MTIPRSPAASPAAAPTDPPEPSPLVAYALEGLRRCWMPEHGRYSHRYRFDVAAPANQSVPASELFYTLNVLLGFSRLPGCGAGEIDVPATYARCCRDAATLEPKTYAYGMALWSGARLGLVPPGAVVDRARAMLADARLQALTAQDVGLLACGATALAVRDGGGWRSLADSFVEHLRRRLYCPATRLFFNSAAGWRRSFSSFASQVYSVLALYEYAEAFGADWALALANEVAARLIGLQGRRGEWPWFYHVPSGCVVDVYEVYSVHQHGMAPAFLHHAARHGVAGAREALVRGFLWLFGDNEMGVSMLRPAERMFYRSQYRRREGTSSWPRALRSLFNAALRRDDVPGRHRGLRLRRECRSYELGWILWSFGADRDDGELTGRPEFAAPAVPLSLEPCAARAGCAN